jgi:hypothetical protein
MTSAEIYSAEAEGKAQKLNGVSAGGNIQFDSLENSQRFAEALKHAVVLCGGTGGHPFRMNWQVDLRMVTFTKILLLHFDPLYTGDKTPPEG